MRFTVITVCYQSESTIADTIRSVAEQQTEEPFEYWIIDGASTDGTLQVIQKLMEKYQDAPNLQIHCLSEPDNGIYHAMNKGIRLSQGEYLIFINSGDVLEKNILASMERRMRDSDSGSVFYGNARTIYLSDGQRLEQIWKAVNPVTKKTLQKGMGFSHQSMFTPREAFKRLGEFQDRYSVGADWDLTIRCYQEGIPFVYCDEIIASVTAIGVSTKPHNKERHVIRKANGLYRFIDFNYLRDMLRIQNLVKKLLGQKTFYRIQLWYRRGKTRKKTEE